MCKRIFKDQTANTGDIPFYKIGTFGKKPDSYISKSLYSEYKSKYNYPKKGEVLISCSGTIGNLVVFDGKDSYFQDSNIMWFSNNENTITNKYLYYFLSKKKWNKQNSTTITRIYKNDLENEIIPNIDKHKQLEISNTLTQIDNLIIKQNLKIKAFNKNNSLIINMLINSSNTNQKKITFNSFFNKEEKKIYVEDNIQYKQLTITNKGDILVRGYNFGRDIGRKRQYIFKYESNVNKLLFIRQGIFNGGIGFAENSSLDNAIVTENMPILVIDESIVSSLFFKYYLKSMQYRREVLYFLKPTGSAQSAIHEKDWLKSNDYFPDLETQIKTANYLSQMDNFIVVIFATSIFHIICIL